MRPWSPCWPVYWELPRAGCGLSGGTVPGTRWWPWNPSRLKRCANACRRPLGLAWVRGGKYNGPNAGALLEDFLGLMPPQAHGLPDDLLQMCWPATKRPAPATENIGVYTVAYLNFSWILEGALAGAQGPANRRDLIFLKMQDIAAVIRMEEQTLSGESLEMVDLFLLPGLDRTGP